MLNSNVRHCINASKNTFYLDNIRRPYSLYCVGADVKPCSIKQPYNQTSIRTRLRTLMDE